MVRRIWLADSSNAKYSTRSPHAHGTAQGHTAAGEFIGSLDAGGGLG
jgi:hypothetical protein